MTTVVKPAEASHVEAIVKLAEEMDRFYGAAEIEPPDLRARQISDAIFSNSPSAHAILAWDGESPVGFASYSFLWPAVGLTKSLYLKELYIVEKVRRQGVGKLIMQHLYQIAIQHGCSRVEWTTDRDNTNAQQFYADLDVPVNRSKLFYRIEGDDLRERARLTLS